ncbi:MAG: FAD-dependent oxidoreductase [Streptococcus minor]|nr:FAD-dependent oxidoreductase [Streptococcus minor]
MKIVIIGASFAGLSAALECHMLYPEAELIVIDKEMEVGYFPNALNWRLRQEISDWSEARSSLYQEVMRTGANLLLGWELEKLVPDEKQVEIRQSGKRKSVTYDYLILAMGARQVWDKQSDDLTDKILASKSLRQMSESYEKLDKSEKSVAIVVVGAGQIGLESLEALSQHFSRLTLIEAQKWPLAKYFDKEMTDWIIEELVGRGIECHFSETVNRIHSDPSGKLLLDTLQHRFQSDYMVMGTNFCPNTETLESILTIQPDGSLLVDEYLETSQEDIFAVGDLIQLPFAFFGHSYLPMIHHAILTGRLVAHNLVTKERKLTTIERIVSNHVFGKHMTSVGLTEREAGLWLDADSIRVQQAHGLLQDEMLDFKLVVEKQSGRLIGGQLLSTSKYTDQMNFLALAISQHLTVQDLVHQSWLYLSDSTGTVSFVLEAAHQYILSKNREE